MAWSAGPPKCDPPFEVAAGPKCVTANCPYRRGRLHPCPGVRPRAHRASPGGVRDPGPERGASHDSFCCVERSGWRERPSPTPRSSAPPRSPAAKHAWPDPAPRRHARRVASASGAPPCEVVSREYRIAYHHERLHVQKRPDSLSPLPLHVEADPDSGSIVVRTRNTSAAVWILLAGSFSSK